MDTITQLKTAIQFAKQNPDSAQAIQLRRRIEGGMYRNELEQIKKESNLTYSAPEKRSVAEKVLGFTGGEKLGQGLGQALANKGISKDIDAVQKSQFEIQGNLIKKIKEDKALGKDTIKLERALTDLNADIEEIGQGTGKLLNQKELTSKQVIGDALQLGTTVLGAGQLPGMAKATVAKTGFLAGAKAGAIQGAKAGAVYGTSSGVSQGLKEDKDLGGIVKSGLIGGATGVASGAVLGGLIGGVTGGLKGRALRKAVLEGKNLPEEKLSLAKQKAIDIAKQQGFDDTDVQFINSMKPQDKIKAQKMIELAEKATKDKRAIERPIDIVGDSMTDRIKFIQNKNSIAGKAVDTTAKALKGQRVDATPVREKALSLLEDIGVTPNKNGTPNWSKSIFKKTPELEKKIMKALSDLPAGEMDAYDLHNFKKSIDEVVNYGVGGEGLKGKSASILKAIRASADEVLDTNFKSYNKANTDYKTTRDVLDVANDLFGKKVGIVKERGGQLLRSVFSNNTQRQRVMALVEQLDKTAKLYGGKFDDNLIDQALFTEILEDIYGTQATTSLQGQVARAVKGTQKVIAGIRDPLKGAGELLAHGAEKALGVSDENKRKILSALLK